MEPPPPPPPAWSGPVSALTLVLVPAEVVRAEVVRPVCVWVPHASNSDADRLTAEPGGGAVLDRSSREPHRLLLLLLMLLLGMLSVVLILLATAVTAVASSDILADAGADVGSGVDEDEEEEEEERQPAPRSPSIKFLALRDICLCLLCT